jgi:predicted dienelactone hydrolase
MWIEDRIRRCAQVVMLPTLSTCRGGIHSVRAYLIALIGTVVLAGNAGAETPAAELHRDIDSPSAGIRAGHPAGLRVTIWRPAAAGSKVEALVIGPPDKPIFQAGEAAGPDSAWPDEARHPLVLMSHGFGGTARQLAWLGTSLARSGYVVVAVDHPGNNGMDTMTVEGATLIAERADDLHLALDAALADPKIGVHVDASRVGVAGFSLGGWTSAVIVGARPDLNRWIEFCTGHPQDGVCKPQKELDLSGVDRRAVLARPDLAQYSAHEGDSRRDPRVRAAFLIAPALGQGVDAKSLKTIRVPFSVVVGEADDIATPATNAEIFAKGVKGAKLEILPKVTHYDFLSPCTDFGRQVAGDYCLSAVDRVAMHEHVAGKALAFFRDALNVRGVASQ